MSFHNLDTNQILGVTIQAARARKKLRNKSRYDPRS